MQYTTGDTRPYVFTITDQDGEAVDLSAATIQFGIRRDLGGGNAERVAGPWDCDAGESGADWSEGVVVGVVPAADTPDLPPGVYLFEVEVTRAGSPETVIPPQKLFLRKGTV